LPSQAALEEMLERLHAHGLTERAFVIAGDLPSPKGPYEDALAIIRSGLLNKYGVKQVGIAGYPEGHPDIPREKLAAALRDKARALAELGMACEITTQFGFDAEAVLTWLKDIRSQGVTAPVRVGLAGPTDMKSLLRFAARCGVSTSTRAFSKYGASLTRMLNTATPDLIVRTLAEGLNPALHGDVKVHLYPFGGLHATAEWARQFSAPPRVKAFG
jgi:methylenetetrahydrofolate reductase (NADPH)